MHIPIPGCRKPGHTRSSRTPPLRPAQESSPTRDCFIRILTTFVREWICGWTYFAGYPHRAGGFHVLDRTRRRTLHPADAEQGTAFGLLLRAGGCDRRHRLCHGGLFAIAFVHGFIEQNQLLLKIIGGAFVVVVGLYIFSRTPWCRYAATGPARSACGAISSPFSLYHRQSRYQSRLRGAVRHVRHQQRCRLHKRRGHAGRGARRGCRMVVLVYVRAEHLPQTLSSPIPALDEPHRRHPYHPAGSDGDNLFPIQYPFR